VLLGDKDGGLGTQSGGGIGIIRGGET